MCRAGSATRQWSFPDESSAPGLLRLGWASGVALLPGGGMIVADYTGRRLLEVDARGLLLHELRDLAWSVASIALVP